MVDFLEDIEVVELSSKRMQIAGRTKTLVRQLDLVTCEVKGSSKFSGLDTDMELVMKMFHKVVNTDFLTPSLCYGMHAWSEHRSNFSVSGISNSAICVSIGTSMPCITEFAPIEQSFAIDTDPIGLFYRLIEFAKSAVLSIEQSIQASLSQQSLL
jgi:hypothetical protein